MITTLSLMAGLHPGAPSMPAVLGGMLTITVAEAMSDELRIHIAEEFKNHRNTLEAMRHQWGEWVRGRCT